MSRRLVLDIRYWRNQVRKLCLALFFCVLALLLVLGGVLGVVVDDQPLVLRTAALTPDEIGRAKRFLERNDPRLLRPRAERTLEISQADLDLASNYLIGRTGRGSARIELQAGVAIVMVSMRVPESPLGSFLNIDAELTNGTDMLQIKRLMIGRLPIPAWLANWLVVQAAARARMNEDLRALMIAVRAVSIGHGVLKVTYAREPGLTDRLRSALISTEVVDRLPAYNERLVEYAEKLRGRGSVSLVAVMQPLFGLARDRAARGEDPIAENRAAILVLALYVNGKDIAALVPAARTWKRPAPLDIRLQGRDDSPQHFTVSAILAASAGGALSDAVGVFKEIDDSRNGSGFSFIDIAANRAGTRFGEQATGTMASAKALQRAIGLGARESEIMPATRDLPEFMPEVQFKRRFGGVGAPAYERMMDTIDDRIRRLPVYR
jgi:hypothetical protein